MRAARSLHGGLAHLFAVLIVLQFFLAGLGAFTTIHNKKFDDNNFGPHAILGTLMAVIALVILIVALVGRWSPRAMRLSGGLFGLMVLQLVLAGIGSDSAPVVGGLHAANALFITAVTYLLVRDARLDRAPAAAV
jgi:hypothetical protein